MNTTKNNFKLCNVDFSRAINSKSYLFRLWHSVRCWNLISTLTYIFYGWVRVVKIWYFDVIFSFICMFCRSLFVLLYFFFWPLCCLFFFDIRFLITPLVSSNSRPLCCLFFFDLRFLITPLWYLQTLLIFIWGIIINLCQKQLCPYLMQLKGKQNLHIHNIIKNIKY